MLSPRILHFTRSQVYWECNEIWANEMYPAGFRDAAYDSTFFTKGGLVDFIDRIELDHPTEPLPEPWGTLSHARRHFLWRGIVEWYTTKALTYHSDKLPALSGISKYLAPLMGPTDTYLAGIWKDQCIVHQLAWYTRSPSLSTIMVESGTPTWSWAATDQPVRYGTYRLFATFRKEFKHSRLGRLERACTVLDVQTILATDDPTGAVTSGFIVLQGHLNRITIRSSPFDSSSFIYTCVNDTYLPFEDITFDRAIDGDDNNSLYLLSLLIEHSALAQIRPPYTELHKNYYFAYLILSPVPGCPGSYQRRGFAAGGSGPHSDPLTTAGGSMAEWAPIWETLPGQEGNILSEAPFDVEMGFRIRLL